MTGAEWGEGPGDAPRAPSKEAIERCREAAVAALEHDFAGQVAVHSPYPRIEGGPVVFRFRVAGCAIEYGVGPETFTVERLEVPG